VSNCKDTYRHYLLNGWGTSPLDASVQFFAVIGNGLEWDADGNLSYVFSGYDLGDIKPKEFREPTRTGFHDLDTRYRLEDEAGRIKYEWVKTNIEDILDGGLSASYFRNNRRSGHYVTKQVCCRQTLAAAFSAPDNIEKDWAEALFNFLSWWGVNLRCEFGCDHKGETNFWEPEQKHVEKMIKDQHERLYMLLHGHSYASTFEHTVQLMKEMFKEDKISNEQTVQLMQEMFKEDKISK